ncbi:AAA family ATPase [Chitinibacter sp. SCUT-21]|uniref:AAA family ATPase n=1 Tax=Chitinibacter sp. SCUT-21 TaxID=2970891 RepID=UPI0035A611AA
MQLNTLQLKNFRCFESFKIEFEPKLTVLVASNGAGKTSILDAIAVALGPYLGSFDQGVGKHFLASDIRLTRVRETQSNEMEYAPTGIALQASGVFTAVNMKLGLIDNEPTHHTWSRSLAGPTKSKTTIKEAKVLIDYGKHMQFLVKEGKDAVLPVLAYYGTGRLWQQKKLTIGKLPKTSRTLGYTDCLDPASSYKSLVEWFRYWNINALNAKLKATQAGLPYIPGEFDAYIASVTNAVNLCLMPSGWKNLTYSFNQEELVAEHEHYGVLPVEQLSDGIRNMIGMVADIAFRATKLNPQLGSSASSSTPGIVLIDEVDMHLHPEWQQVVLLGLRAAFPCIQFIVTTHSPQVLSTVSKAHIRVIVQTENGWQAEKPDMSPLGRAAGDALAQIMLTHQHPPLEELLSQVRTYEQMVKAGHEHSDNAKGLLQSLTVQGYEIPEADLALWRFLAQHGSGAANG